MNSFQCPNCDRKFNRKAHLEQHFNKKNPCVKIPIKNEEIPINPNKSIKNPEIVPNDIKVNQEPNINELDLDPSITCQYCMKTFYQTSNLNKHIKYNCKIKKQQDEEKEDIFKRLLLQEELLKEKDAQIHKLISQNDVLINKICVLEEKVDKISNISKSVVNTKKTINNTTNVSNSNSNNTTNNTTNNTLNTSNTSNTNNGIIVQLVNYGKEDLDKIDIKHFINNIVKNNKVCGVKIPEEILKLIHFNPAYPELNNIYISDINREKCMIYDDGMWKLSPDDKIPEVIEKVVSFSYDKENELREKYSNNKPLMDRLNTINKYTKFNDNEYLETLKEEQEEEQTNNKDEIKRCEDFQKKTYDTFKTTMYNEGQKIKKQNKSISNKN